MRIAQHPLSQWHAQTGRVNPQPSLGRVSGVRHAHAFDSTCLESLQKLFDSPRTGGSAAMRSLGSTTMATDEASTPRTRADTPAAATAVPSALRKPRRFN